MSLLSLASRRFARQLFTLAIGALVLSGCSLLGDRTERTQPSSRPLPGEQASSQVIDPNVERPEPEVRTVKAQDFEAGAYFGGVLVNTDDGFDIYGLRAAYQLTESLFAEGFYETASNVGYDELRSLLGLDKKKQYNYDYDTFGLSLGYKLAPGDIYLSKRYTLPFQIYAIGGGGYTTYEGDNFASYHIGGGIKLMPRDWLSIRFEAKDHLWKRNGSLDHNAQLTVGLAILF